MATTNKYDMDGLLKSKYIAENLASIMPYDLKRKILTTHIYNHIKTMKLIKLKEMEDQGLFKCDYCYKYRFDYKMEILNNGKLRCCECSPRNK
tara:strand:- start:2924 stop:3202 length:279 start_codon:yes stop_codon:yes gene_type:complete